MSQSGIQKTYMADRTVERRWYHVDADGKILGRLAVELARLLQGKTKPQYTPHCDVGDFIVVTNAHKITLSGDKRNTKEYQFFSGYPDGQRIRTFREMIDRRPEDVIRLAVRRMLPKSRLGKRMLLKLKIHKELPKHGYKAQKLEPLASAAMAGARA